MAILTGIKVKKDELRSVLAAIKRATRENLLVGIPYYHTARPGEVGISNADLGYIHEFGAPAANIPARPALIPGVLAATKQATALMADGMSDEMAGQRGSAHISLHKAGLVAVNYVRQTITDGVEPELSEVTIRRRLERGRTGTTPLLDTGQYRNAFTYVIRHKGQTDAAA
ncbi:putative bacteriophage protein [Rhodanobacter fulvus Jip2]|uniref:Putative bacteriophage protein n=1 Tax=Rhodanobacter fulvus Jip2 TaxID=1163408 RepID=I4VMU2_9GAMM|nr:hypothetical protein [Rhodanobacter fulvus]EIL88533.1 putative bacteriophage protein [Rhodanobacter fulvus Jip2]